jgi:Domain of unknown function (DUF4872)/Butirosin biosynthesis protein H, N-terminal
MSGLTKIDHVGGRHDETAALAAALAAAGVVVPGANEPISEALLFGICGGIGVGYTNSPGHVGWSSGIALHGRHKAWSTGPDFVVGGIERLGLQSTIRETSDARAAQSDLVSALAASEVPLVWVNKCLVPHLALPATHLAYWFHHVLCVYELDEASGQVTVGDFPPGVFRMTAAELARARVQVTEFRHRSLTIARGAMTAERLNTAIRSGIAATVAELGRPRNDGHSFQSLRDLAVAMTSAKHPKGWPRLYPNGKIYAALRDTYATAEAMAGGGGFYRDHYADFLETAGAVAGNRRIADMAKTYRKLAAAWTEFADACLPNDVAPFRETKQLWKERFSLFRRKGAEYAPKVKKHAERQLQLDQWLVRDFPLGGRDIEKLLVDASKRLAALVEEETAALGRLDAAIA